MVGRELLVNWWQTKPDAWLHKRWCDVYCAPTWAYLLIPKICWSEVWAAHKGTNISIPIKPRDDHSCEGEGGQSYLSFCEPWEKSRPKKDKHSNKQGRWLYHFIYKYQKELLKKGQTREQGWTVCSRQQWFYTCQWFSVVNWLLGNTWFTLTLTNSFGSVCFGQTKCVALKGTFVIGHCHGDAKLFYTTLHSTR